jgi:YD repeat-containing protein
MVAEGGSLMGFAVWRSRLLVTALVLAAAMTSWTARADAQTGQPGFYTYNTTRLDDETTIGVNVGSGNLLLSARDRQGANNDLLPPARYYNSLADTSNSSGLGPRWSLAINPDVSVQRVAGSNSREVVGPTGDRVTLTADASTANTWRGPSGYGAVLTLDGNGDYELAFSNGDVLVFFGPRAGVPEGKIARFWLGTEMSNGAPLRNYTVSSGTVAGVPRITRFDDFSSEKNLTQYVFSYDATTARLKSYEWLHDGTPTVTFAYDANGSITSASSQSLGTSGYAYENGRLTRIQQPNGTVADVSYDASGRVTSMTSTAPDLPPRTTTFAYSDVAAPCDSATHIGMTTVTSPDGNQTVYCIDRQFVATPADMPSLHDVITAQMSQPNSDIRSVGEDDTLDVVDVGMGDPGGAEALDLKARYGDKVSISQEDDIESLAGAVGAPVAGADTERDPMLAGVHISNGTGVDCTAGFMFRGRRTDNSTPAGVITAGHCLFADPLTTEWQQGGSVLGPYTSHRYVNNTLADAGTITTEFADGTGSFRKISNEVFVGAGQPTVKIERVAPAYSGQPDLEVCISGAYGGYSCGKIDKVGHERTPSGLRRGFDYALRENGRRIVVQNVYRMRRDSGSCQKGDSGAPVFRLTGTAMGIAFARDVKNPQRCYFAQQANAEYELNVRTYVGG